MGNATISGRVRSKFLFIFVAYLPELTADPNKKKHTINY